MAATSLPAEAPAKRALLQRLLHPAPRSPKIALGLDIGSSAVKAVLVGAQKSSGARPLLGQHLVTFNDSSDQQIAAAVKEVLNAIRVPSVRTLNLSVSGQTVIMRVVEMPLLTTAELTQALPFEAQRYLPFDIKEVVVDGTILGPAPGKKLWVLIVGCKRDSLERRIGWVKEAGFEPAVVDVDALALANAFVQRTDPQKLAGTHALINVGAQWTNLVVLKTDVPYLVRDIPWGAEKLIRQVAERTGSDQAAVATQLKQDVPPSPELVDAMKGACESVTADLQLSFDFFESRFGAPPEHLLVTGGLSRCAGFIEALKGHLAQPPIPWTPQEGLSGQFAVAYGLALRAGVV